MQQTGQLQPICVRGSGEHYEIVYGERRHRAAQRAGFTHIKALVYEHLTDEDAEDMAITENLQREDERALEEGAQFPSSAETAVIRSRRSSTSSARASVTSVHT